MKTLFKITSALVAVGCALYGLAGFSSTFLATKWLVLFGRLLIGLGAGSLSLVRAYFALISTKENRTKAMAMVALVQYGGFALTPALGSFILRPHPEGAFSGDLLEMESVPGWLLFVFSSVTIVALHFWFSDHSQSTPAPTEISSSGSLPAANAPTSRDIYIIYVAFLAINFLIRAVLGTVETLGAPVYDSWLLAVSQTGSSGYFFGLLGVVGMAFLVLLLFLGDKMRDLHVLLGGLLAAVVGNAILIGVSSDMTLLRLSCGMGLLWSISYPIAQTVIASMFSRIPGSNTQGVKMSWIGSAGSLGRVVGPIVAAAIYSSAGQIPTFAFAAVTSFVTLIVPLVLARKLSSL